MSTITTAISNEYVDSEFETTDLNKAHEIFEAMAASYVGNPRKRRIGGFVMDAATAFDWASRLHGRTVRPVYENHLAYQIIMKKIRSHQAADFDKNAVDFKNVGEIPHIEWMIVTQVQRFPGWVGMDPEKIPQFKEGPREKLGRKLLADEGIPETAYEFKTMLY